MPYRDELEQAHLRIEELQEELEEERAKNAPPPPVPEPEIRIEPGPTTLRMPEVRAEPSLEWFLWWPIPLTLVAAVLSFVHFHEETMVWVFRSAFAGGALMSFEALARWRNGGDRNVLSRILIVLACIVGAPALLAAFMVGGPIVGFGFGAVAAVMGIVALVRSMVKGES